MPKINDDEFYYTDLINFDVISQNNKIFGKLIGFYNNKAQDLAEIKNINGKIITFPFVKPLIVEINEKKKLLL